MLWFAATTALFTKALAVAFDPETGTECTHCQVGDGFDDLLRPNVEPVEGQYTSDVHLLWPAHVEVIPITTDIGGWEPTSFNRKLSSTAVDGWRRFKSHVLPSLPKGHMLREQSDQRHAGAVNDAFFHWQKSVFEASGDTKLAIDMQHEPGNLTPPPSANSSWPEMNGLPEYQKLRKIVEKTSRRYLVRSGMVPSAAAALNYSIFNWAAINKPGEFHGPHTHVGEFHVGVYYAQVGPASGKLRLGDPRGVNPPFGREFLHTPKAGELILFPSWLSHMATVTAASSDLPKNYDKEPLRVIFAFNIGPVTGPLPCPLWWTDPTGDMRFKRTSTIPLEEMGLK